jgi:N-acetylmuramoyl-L-alanine amidase
MRNTLIAIFISALFYTAWSAGAYPQALTYVNDFYNKVDRVIADTGQYLATVILHKTLTVAELKDKYNSPTPKRIRVLLVPGHEPGYGGAEYGSLKEREMNVELANYLSQFLKSNDHYEVIVARDNDKWNPIFLNYFISQWNDIIAFFRENRDENLRNISVGTNLSPGRTSTSTPTQSTQPKVEHNVARNDVALRLYGINKWGNENSIDIAIHIHINDNPRRNPTGPGVYSGFTMYVPEKEYTNSPTTKAVAETIFKRLAKYNPVSDLPIEDNGIVDEGDLIAIGAHNTANAASMLIEYGYIYEPQFQDPTVRSKTLKDMAFQTYLGLQDFFGSGNDVSFAYDTLMLPHAWDDNLSKGTSNSEDALALQSALLLEGFYPGAGKTKNDCPRTGKIGPCTLDALSAFQKRYGIKGEEGFVGEKTRLILNGKYSVRAI